MNMGIWVVGTSNQLFIRLLIMKPNLKKTNQLLVKLRSVFYFVLPTIFFLTLASQRAVLYVNVAFSMLLLSTKKLYFSFFKKIFVFQKIYFNDLVLKTFKNFQWLSHKNMSISQTECYFENPYDRLLEKSVLFLLALKRNLPNTERFSELR